MPHQPSSHAGRRAGAGRL